MRVLIGGSHGLVGSALFDHLKEEGHEPVRLVRGEGDATEVRWKPYEGVIDKTDLEGFDAVIGLGGVSIGEKRWTEKQKAALWDSRVVSTEMLVKSFEGVRTPPKTFISASAIGYYGNGGDKTLTESSPLGDGFMAELCSEWEKSADFAEPYFERIVKIRSGLVFSGDGGLLPRQAPLFRLCLGGRLGTGKQWMSWIDIEDEVRAIMFLLQNDKVSGPVNLVAPQPITNADFTKAFAKAVHRPAIVPVPRWMLATTLGSQLTDEALLASQKVAPKKLVDSGFKFNHSHAGESLVRNLAPEELDEYEFSKSSHDFRLKPRASRAAARAASTNGKSQQTSDTNDQN